jgi:hypothetical protein
MAAMGEYDISIKRAIEQDDFDPNSSDLIVHFAAWHAWVTQTRVETRRDAKQVWLIARAEYNIIPWFGVTGQWEYQNPLTTVSGDEFHNLQGSLIFRSDWASPDTVDLRYRHYFRSARTLINPAAPPDNDVFELIAEVAW